MPITARRWSTISASTNAQIAAAAQRMITDGRHELAAATLSAAQARHPDSPTLAPRARWPTRS